jgi:aspartate racemase
MAKHIGIVGCSAEGAALCYRTICLEAPQFMGAYFHPEISMHTHSLGDYMGPIQTGDWPMVAALMLSSVKNLKQAGAEFAICPDNTIHQAFPYIVERSELPWLHIAEVIAQKAEDNKFKNLAILGTKYLMEGPVYSRTLEKYGIDFRIPQPTDREKIDRIIFTELVLGIFSEENRLYFNQVIQQLKKEGCDAVVLGCTEIPLLVDPADCPLPTLDSTRLLARAAINYSLQQK